MSIMNTEISSSILGFAMDFDATKDKLSDSDVSNFIDDSARLANNYEVLLSEYRKAIGTRASDSTIAELNRVKHENSERKLEVKRLKKQVNALIRLSESLAGKLPTI